MPPIISIVGRSKSGKTTLIEKLIVELKSRGYHVATAKHTHRDMTAPQSDKDSDRHLRAGSEASLIIDPHGLMMIKPLQQELTLAQIAQIIGEDYDLILTEGYKADDAPKIEVHRKDNAPLLTDIKKLFAIATDEPLDTKVRQFGLDDVKPIADLIETGFIKPNQERFTLLVNDVPIVLNAFTGEFVENVTLAMANNLKGVGKIGTLKIFLKKTP
ncbi:MAG: molybdopterin-guanine dinucleotide biosynthesis protein B [Dehalococcoidales bacterium]|jgi:molybdopterin-guanine dinucleotide biosynthesis protein B